MNSSCASVSPTPARRWLRRNMPKFFSASTAVKRCREQEGVGLGLYLAREILRSQGGYIKAESLHDGRVRFSLYLLK